jgi:hypothetical protein
MTVEQKFAALDGGAGATHTKSG